MTINEHLLTPCGTNYRTPKDTPQICPQCGKPMLLHFAKKPFRPIIACVDCGTFIAADGSVKTCVGKFTVNGIEK